MGGEGLDARLEPIAQALILVILLIGVAAISFFIINKVAIRRKEKAHNKLSASRRSKHTWVDLSGGSGTSESREGSKHRKRRRSSSNHVMLDILAKPKQTKDVAPAPDQEPS